MNAKDLGEKITQLLKPQGYFNNYVNEIEAGFDLVLICTSPVFYVNDAVLMLTSSNLCKMNSEVSIEIWTTPASLSFKGQATKHTNVNLVQAWIVSSSFRKDKLLVLL